MHNAAFFIRYKLHHLFVWMLLFGLWFMLRYEDYPAGQKAFLVTLIKVADLAIMVYITNYLLIPRLLYKKHYVSFALAFLVMIVLSSALKMNILGRLLDNPLLLNLTGNLKQRLYDNVIPHFFLVTAGAAIKLMVDHTRMQQRMTEMAREKAEAELNFLKSQINPHFLFNSLNSVYFLIDKNNTEARGALHKFSAMLRYQLYEMNGRNVPVEKEIEYLNDYIDLQKLRKDEQCEVGFSASPEVRGFTLEPLLLIPFVENAFKHISQHPDKPNFIRGGMTMQGNRFRFLLENSQESDKKGAHPHSGIGLANVRRRLELLYPGRHDLRIQNENGVFTVDLFIHV